jgi:hypothetical protein
LLARLASEKLMPLHLHIWRRRIRITLSGLDWAFLQCQDDVSMQSLIIQTHRHPKLPWC